MSVYYQRIFVTLAFCCSLLSVSSQKHFDARAFESQMQAYVIQQARLTAEESRSFIPLYKEMVAKKRKLHGELRQIQRQHTDNARMARTLIERADNLEVRMKQVERSYHQRMLKVLNAVKVKAVLDAERKYHHMMFRKAAGKRR